MAETVRWLILMPYKLKGYLNLDQHLRLCTRCNQLAMHSHVGGYCLYTPFKMNLAPTTYIESYPANATGYSYLMLGTQLTGGMINKNYDHTWRILSISGLVELLKKEARRNNGIVES